MSCCRLTNESIEVVWDDPRPMDIVYAYVAEIAMDPWQCPDASWFDSPEYEGATEHQV